MKNRVFYIVLVLVFLAGLSLLLYPTVSNAYNSWLQSRAVAEYTAQTGKMDQQIYEREMEKAQTFNTELLNRENPFTLPEEMLARYNETLAVTDGGIMAYIKIPAVDVTLPIAHGTSDEVLKDKIGHLEWSSLPVGGKNTHCVISGHRGLPSSELFTNIDHLEVGDKFYLYVLGQTLEYQVCHIAVVEPHDQRLLRVEEGQDLVTLVTCTPYGINSHRLLVRGIRTGTQSGDMPVNGQVKNEVAIVDVLVLVMIMLVVAAVVAFIWVLLSNNQKKGGRHYAKKDR
ncbi:MAG: class C sortase [Clostridia bacterium]|nr:class C sortase [Clostridia bacterium]